MRDYKYIFACLFSLPLIWGCTKVVNGYLSNRIFYQVNPFYVQQGVTTASSSLVAEGSTQPLNVKLLSIVNAVSGESADSMFLHPDTIKTFAAAVLYTDTTLDMLNAKLKDSAVAPFSVNSIGGRLQFTQATSNVDTGSYNISLQVSNVRGTETLNNICQIDVIPIATIDTTLYWAWSTSDSAGNFFTLPTALQMSVSFNPAGEDKIVYEFKDVNGNNFNPAAGEVIERVGRPNFHNWDPYYPMVLTDTSIEYAYPEGVPYFPAYSVTTIANGTTWASGETYYQVSYKHTNSRLNVNPVSEVNFYVTKGEYIITYYLNNVTRVP
jgi:hypothetical protein